MIPEILYTYMLPNTDNPGRGGYAELSIGTYSTERTRKPQGLRYPSAARSHRVERIIPIRLGPVPRTRPPFRRVLSGSVSLSGQCSGTTRPIRGRRERSTRCAC